MLKLLIKIHNDDLIPVSIGTLAITNFLLGTHSQLCIFVKNALKKKPDSVVWDEATNAFVAKLLPYASSVSGPLIDIPNVDAFKRKGVEKASKILNAELEELQTRIQQFVAEASNTQRVYAATYKFEPIVGETYHLYEGKTGDFLSIIPPSQWRKTHIGSFRLTSDFKWEIINN